MSKHINRNTPTRNYHQVAEPKPLTGSIADLASPPTSEESLTMLRFSQLSAAQEEINYAITRLEHAIKLVLLPDSSGQGVPAPAETEVLSPIIVCLNRQLDEANSIISRINVLTERVVR